jgi:hypothetical protein
LLRLRHDGVLISRDRRPNEWTEGHLQSVAKWDGKRLVRVVEFRAIGDAVVAKPRGKLYDPTLVEIGADWMTLRGVEKVRRGRSAAAVIQEWRLGVQGVVPPGGHYGPPLGELEPSV